MISKTWDQLLKSEYKKPYFIQLMRSINEKYRQGPVYPPYEKIFRALQLTPPDKVKIVILGQDPYFNEGQANGLCFSVNKGIAIPKSLKNIYTELVNDVQITYPNHGDLTSWATQGVLLLNTVLTVEAGKPNSHKNIGWEVFIEKIIKTINSLNHPIVFLLWGNHAKSYMRLIDNSKHHILTAPHPSPLSAYRGYFGCEHFSKANKFLINSNQIPINWQI